MLKSNHKVGLIGLGLMGRGIGHSLIRAGFSVGFTVHKRRTVAEELLALGAWEADSPARLAHECDAVVICVSSAEASVGSILGVNGVVKGAKSGTVVIESSSLTPSTASTLSTELSNHGLIFIDAPVSRGPREAMEGKLIGIVGGSKQDIATAEPYLSAYCEKLLHVGKTGSGYATKLLANFMAFNSLVAVGEMVSTALSAELDMNMVLTAINMSGGQTRVLDNLAPWIAAGKETNGLVTIATALKDVRYFREFSESVGVKGQISPNVEQALVAATDAGIGDNLTRFYVKYVASQFGQAEKLSSK